MAISELVQYEREYPVRLKKPGGDEVGVTFWVRSLQSKPVSAAIDAARKRAIASASGGGSLDEDLGFDILSAAIVRWDWGKEEFEAGKGAPEFTPENVRMVLGHMNARWIYNQVEEAAATLANFT